MRVTIMSREKYLSEYKPPKENMVAIRISTEAPVRDIRDKLFDDVLYLGFEDYLYGETDVVGHHRFSDDEKIQIDKFIEKYADRDFVVHCQKGASRSPAVGYYILKTLGETEELIEKRKTGLYSPNIDVYVTLNGETLDPKNPEIREKFKNEIKTITD